MTWSSRRYKSWGRLAGIYNNVWKPPGEKEIKKEESTSQDQIEDSYRREDFREDSEHDDHYRDEDRDEDRDVDRDEGRGDAERDRDATDGMTPPSPASPVSDDDLMAAAL